MLCVLSNISTYFMAGESVQELPFSIWMQFHISEAVCKAYWAQHSLGWKNRLLRLSNGGWLEEADKLKRLFISHHLWHTTSIGDCFVFVSMSVYFHRRVSRLYLTSCASPLLSLKIHLQRNGNNVGDVDHLMVFLSSFSKLTSLHYVLKHNLYTE